MAEPRKYKFLFVSAPFGGIEVFCKNIQKVVETKQEIEATWMWIDFYPNDFIARIPPISLNWTLKGGLIARTRLSRLERQGKIFDAAFFNHTIPLMFLQQFSQRVPIILSLDITPELLMPYSKWYRGKESKNNTLGSGIKHRLTKNIYKNVSYVLPWSNLVMNSLLNDYNVDKEKISVVPPGIDINAWNNTHSTRNKNNGATQILFVGGDFLRKGGDILLRIAHRADFKNCIFHFVTKSFQGEAGNNVHIYNNLRANSKELINLYNNADIFALPTRADLSPAVLCEAMAFQLPVVATKVGGLDEIVVDGETGYTVASDDEETFAVKLKSLIDSPVLRSSFGQKARVLVEKKYNIQKNANTVLEFMKRSVDKKMIHNTTVH